MANDEPALCPHCVGWKAKSRRLRTTNAERGRRLKTGALDFGAYVAEIAVRFNTGPR